MKAQGFEWGEIQPMDRNAKDMEDEIVGSGGGFTAIQISKRVHRKVKLACLHDDRLIGQTTDEIMEAWANGIAKEMGFTFPEEVPNDV